MQILLHSPVLSPEEEKRLRRSLQALQQEVVFQYLKHSGCPISLIKKVLEKHSCC